MKVMQRLSHSLAIAVLFIGAHQYAAANGKANVCAAPPYGMTPAAMAFWKEGIIDAAKATAAVQEICRMKSREISRKPLHELGFSDETIDRASPLSLLYQRIGAERLAAQNLGNLRQLQSASSQQTKSTIRVEDIKMSEQRFQQAVYSMSFNGQFGSELQMLGRLGVPFQDQQGHARDFGEVLSDTASALQRLIASRQMTKQEALFAAREAGLYGSVATAVANNEPGLVSAYKKAKAVH